ncbi:MAG: putative Ig domain-containing protein [Ignavibacteriae bacterium]|nr:putative Ig domain-containing protein [Ignavibacteriota bacterium]
MLFTSGGSLIGEATTTTEASEVTFLRVPATSGYQYWVYVTQTKYPNIWGEAYWGRKTGITIMNGVTVVDTFRHNTPIMPGLAVYDNNDVELKAMSNRVLQPGVPIRFELTLENPANAGATVVNVYAKTYIDRNWSRAIDDTAQSSVYSLSVGSRTIWYFTRTTPSDPGIYAFAFGAFATGPGYSDRLTDGSNWHDSVFIIQAPPVLTSISPTVVDAGGPAISLTAYGSGFVPGSVVRFNSSDRITRYVSSTQLEAALTSADLAAVSDYTITVNNPAAGGGTSYAQPFRVQYPAPQLNQLSPPSRVAGSTGFTLSVDGTGFFSTSVVNWNGGSKSTSYTSGTRFFAGGDGPTSRSTDHGATWTSISNGLPSTWVYAFARTNSRVFAATYSGVFVTTDEGTNWSSAGLASMDVEALAVSGVYLLAGTYTSGVRYSTNAGSTWFQSDLASEAVRALMAVGNLVFAGTKNGVYVSTNNGVNWTQKSSGLLNTDVRAFTVIGGTVFAGTDGGGVYRSTNSGATWTWSYAAGINASAIALTAVGDYLFAGSYGVAGGVYRSTNGGTSWVATSTSVGNWIQSLAAYGGRLYAGTDAGVYVSTNFGVTWTKAGSPVTKILALDVSGGRLDATISSTDIASPGDYDVTVTNPVPVAGPSGKLTFRVDPASLAISTASPLPAGTTGVTYTTTVAASGGTLPYSWSLSSGALPTGLSLTPATGVISGIPIAGIAPASFQIRVTDNAGAHTEKDLSLSIYNPAPIISSLSPSSKTAGEAGFPLTVYGTGFINGSIVRVNASDRTTEFVSSTQLTATILTGDIASAGNLSVTVFTGIPGGGSSDPPATLTVNPVGLAITTSTPLPGGVVGTVYSTTLGASGGTPPYSWSLASGTWPSGLTMNSSGRVTGTPRPRSMGGYLPSR